MTLVLPNEQWLIYTYGLTHTDYERMYKDQNGRCACCNDILDTETPRSIHIDHDHKTNEVRGLLCPSCNLMLGFAHDSIRTLANAIVYLEDHGKTWRR